MEETILISYLNDFIFCPVSIYFHKLYGQLDKNIYQSTFQVNGTDAHKSIDEKTYSSRKNILQGISQTKDVRRMELKPIGEYIKRMKLEKTDLAKGRIDEEEYQMWLNDTLRLFNVPISAYLYKDE